MMDAETFRKIDWEKEHWFRIIDVGDLRRLRTGKGKRKKWDCYGKAIGHTGFGITVRVCDIDCDRVSSTAPDRYFPFVMLWECDEEGNPLTPLPVEPPPKVKPQKPIYTKICKVCGKEYETANIQSRYCSKECREKHMKTYPKVLYCPQCGKEFKPLRNKRFCSRACCQKFYNNRKPGKKEVEKNG